MSVALCDGRLPCVHMKGETTDKADRLWMELALALARRGEG